MTEKLEIGLGANVADLETGMRRGAAVVEEQLGKIKAIFDGFRASQTNLFSGVQSGAQTSTTELKNLSSVMTGARSQITGIGGVAQSSGADLQRMGGIMSGVRSQLIGLFSGIALFEAAKQVVGVASSFEQLQIALNSTMGSAEKGKNAFDWIVQFAKETPLSVDKTTEAFLMLKNFGLDPMDGSLKAISDQAAKFKNPAETMQRVSLALGQAWSRTKLQGQDILQMVEAGVPVWDMLAKVTGKNTAELQKLSEKGALGRDVIKALINEMGRQSAGAAAAQMASMSGQWSNVVDNIQGVINKVRTAGGFDPLKRSLQDVNAEFTQLGQSGAIDDFAKKASQAFSQVDLTVREFGATLQVVIDLADQSFSALGKSASDMSGEQITAFSVLISSLKVVQSAFVLLRLTIQEAMLIIKTAVNESLGWVIKNWVETSNETKVAGEYIGQVVERMAIRLRNFAEIAKKAMMLDFAGISDVWSKGTAEIEQKVKESQERIAAYRKDTKDNNDNVDKSFSVDFSGEDKKINDKAKSDLQNVWNPIKPQDWTRSPEEVKASQKTNAPGSPTKMELSGTDEKAEKKAFDARIARLNTEMDLYQQNYDKKLEIARRVLSEVEKEYGKDSKEYEQAQQKIIEIEQRKQDQLKQIREIGAEAQADLKMGQIEEAQRAAEWEAQIGAITQQELLTKLRQFEDQRYQIAKEGLQQRIALEEQDPVRRAQLNAEMQKLDQQHGQRTNELGRRSVTEQMRIWDKFGDSWSGLWDKGLDAMMQGTLTWKNAQNAIFAEMGRFFLTTLVTEPLKKWMAAQAMKAAAAMGFAGAEKALAASSAATEVGITTAAASAEIGAHGATAAAGAAASQAAIPVIGPGLALAAMGATLAAVLALRGQLHSASGGFDVPAGVNPLTQLHSKEMVLPAPYADVIRGMAGGVGGGGASVPNINLTLNAHAIDAKGMEAVLKKQGPALAKIMREQVRNFNSSTRG